VPGNDVLELADRLVGDRSADHAFVEILGSTMRNVEQQLSGVRGRAAQGAARSSSSITNGDPL